MTTVLVVDDEWLIAMALEAALEDEGYRVLTATNGRQGLERLAEARADVVLLDMMMPVMNGPAMFRAMESNPALRDIPVIFLSSLPKETIREQIGDGALVLNKPYMVQDVLAAIARALGRDGKAEG